MTDFAVTLLFWLFVLAIVGFFIVRIVREYKEAAFLHKLTSVLGAPNSSGFFLSWTTKKMELV